MKRVISLVLSLCLLIFAVPAMASNAPVELTMWTLFSGEDGSTMNQIVEISTIPRQRFI